jgi:hypothetical protein
MTLRPAEAIFATAATTAVVGGLAVTLVLSLAGVGGPRLSLSAAACALALVSLAARIFIRFDDDAVTVQNTWRRHVISWDSIQDVSRAEMWPSPTALLLIASCLAIRSVGRPKIYIQSSITRGAKRQIVAELRKGAQEHAGITFNV